MWFKRVTKQEQKEYLDTLIQKEGWMKIIRLLKTAPYLKVNSEETVYNTIERDYILTDDIDDLWIRWSGIIDNLIWKKLETYTKKENVSSKIVQSGDVLKAIEHISNREKRILPVPKYNKYVLLKGKNYQEYIHPDKGKKDWYIEFVRDSQKNILNSREFKVKKVPVEHSVLVGHRGLGTLYTSGTAPYYQNMKTVANVKFQLHWDDIYIL
jgi:hypothetical protein